jgi:transcriptional regulator with XRE-family HTH domain
VHRNQISTYELGKAGAHPDTIRKLARALGVDPSELVARDTYTSGRGTLKYRDWHANIPKTYKRRT